MSLISESKDSAAWTTRDIGSADSWTVHFSAAEIEEMAAVVEAARRDSLTAEDAPDSLFDWPSVHTRMRSILPELQAGRGFVVMAGLPTDRFSKDDLAVIYWGLGVSLGEGVSQSAKGDRLGHVRDMSMVDANARAYQNKNELNPHTDHTELVGLLCLRDSLSGGETPLASALTIHDEILASRPDLMPILYRGFRYHRRGEQQPGEPEITPYRVPVFSRTEGRVSCRLIRPYIEAAAAELGEPLTAAEIEALDLVQDLARDPRFVLSVRLQPGSLVLFNNYVLLHARTPFVDHEEPDRKRHLLRLWLLPENFRPVPPEIELYSTRGGVQRREGGQTQAYNWGVGGH